MGLALILDLSDQLELGEHPLEKLIFLLFTLVAALIAISLTVLGVVVLGKEHEVVEVLEHNFACILLDVPVEIFDQPVCV